MAEERLREEHVDRLYGPVGQIVLFWGFVDISLTDICLKMLQILKTPEASHDLQQPFGRRLEFVRANLEGCNEFSCVKADGLGAIEDIRKAKIVRDRIVHGVAVAYDPTEDAVAFSRIDRLSAGQKRKFKSTHSHMFGRMWLPFRVIDQTSGRCLAIAKTLDSVVGRLNELLSEPDRSND